MRVTAVLCLGAFLQLPNTCLAWSNRGHRMVNRVAAETLPTDVPSFMRTADGIAEISYFGPEPDRWRPNTAPELSRAAGPDHFFRYEIGVSLSPLPRRRYDYLRLLEQARQQHPAEAEQLTPQFTGTLPWQVEEIYERLVTAFVDYRLVHGDIPASAGVDMVPMTKADLPYIENAALLYAGWLGHYVGDGCMPLHDSINLAGWAEKENPHAYTTKGTIHHQLEIVADDAIEQGKINAGAIEHEIPRQRVITDSFADILRYVSDEGQHAEQVYQFEKQGALTGGGTAALDDFITSRMAEGGGKLRDLIYSAWLQSKDATAPALPSIVPVQPR